MKIVVALLLSCAALCCAQDVKTDDVKRLGAVTWDLATHKLIWTVEKGSIVDGEFITKTKVKYEVSPDEAFMENAGKKRTFGDDEAAALQHLLGVLSLYCVESVVWWDQGETTTDDPATAMPGLVTKPAPTETKPAPSDKKGPPPVKVDDKDKKASPPVKVAMVRNWL
jgi:hypothetical protein